MKDIAFPSCEECEIQSGFFCAFSKGLKKEIGQDKRHLKIKKGENLFTQGSHAIGLYCLYKGKVKLTKMGKDGKEQRSEEHTSELQSRPHLVCRLLLEKKKKKNKEESI